MTWMIYVIHQYIKKYQFKNEVGTIESTEARNDGITA